MQEEILRKQDLRDKQVEDKEAQPQAFCDECGESQEPDDYSCDWTCGNGCGWSTIDK